MSREDPFWFLAKCVRRCSTVTRANTKWTQRWWMRAEVASRSAVGKKWDVLVWRRGTIWHFCHANQWLLDVCCGEAGVWKPRLEPFEAAMWTLSSSSLPLVMNPSGVKVTEEWRRSKRDDLGGMKTATIEGRQTYCARCRSFSRCSTVSRVISISRARHANRGRTATEHQTSTNYLCPSQSFDM